MKKITIIVASLFALAFFSTSTSAATCGAKFMKDPCPVDGYSIVNTERFVRGRHNRMHDIHYFNDLKKATHTKRAVYGKRVHRKKVHPKRRYKYVKRCRTVKVRL